MANEVKSKSISILEQALSKNRMLLDRLNNAVSIDTVEFRILKEYISDIEISIHKLNGSNECDCKWIEDGEDIKNNTYLVCKHCNRFV